VKIADFGIARPAAGESTTGTGRISGTCLYLAPEAARGEAAGPPGDVYSLGCALYELLTGRPPFVADHPVAVLCQHVEAAPTDPCVLRPEVPTELGAYVLRMLAKEPVARPTAQQAADHFAAPAPADADTERSVTATLPWPAATFPEPPPASGHRRGRALAGAAAVTAALAAAAFAITTPLTGSDHAPGAPSSVSRSTGHAGSGSQPSAEPTATLPDTMVAPAGDARTVPHGHGHTAPGGHGKTKRHPKPAPSVPGNAPSAPAGSHPSPTNSPTPSDTPTPTPSDSPSTSGG
jgi:eukaryotic-like serine/threonine-protein kinase